MNYEPPPEEPAVEIQRLLKTLREMEAAMHPNPHIRKVGRYAKATNLGDQAWMVRRRIKELGGTIPYRTPICWG